VADSISLPTRQEAFHGQTERAAVWLSVSPPSLPQPTGVREVKDLGNNEVCVATKNVLAVGLLVLALLVGLVLSLAGSILGCLAAVGDGLVRVYRSVGWHAMEKHERKNYTPEELGGDLESPSGRRQNGVGPL
jgi:hypothetical protein